MAERFGFALTVQQLPRGSDRVLVLSDVAARRAADGWFRSAELSDLFIQFRIPLPGNPSQQLADLGRQGHVIRHPSQRPVAWSVTPRGRARVLELTAGLPAVIADEGLLEVPGATVAEVAHPLVPHSMAPMGLVSEVSRFLRRWPFDSNVFCITRFPEETEPLAEALEVAKVALRAHGLQLHRADDAQLHDELYGNVAAYMWSCRYGLAFLDLPRRAPHLNLNVAMEVGSMIMTGRRCGLLKDVGVDRSHIPSDLIARIYKEVDVTKNYTVAAAVHQWAAADLGLGPCATCST